MLTNLNKAVFSPEKCSLLSYYYYICAVFFIVLN